MTERFEGFVASKGGTAFLASAMTAVVVAIVMWGTMRAEARPQPEDQAQQQEQQQPEPQEVQCEEGGGGGEGPGDNPGDGTQLAY